MKEKPSEDIPHKARKSRKNKVFKKKVEPLLKYYFFSLRNGKLSRASYIHSETLNFKMGEVIFVFLRFQACDDEVSFADFFSCAKKKIGLKKYCPKVLLICIFT